ncbi:MAG: hypothetical protein LBS60_08940 [Deltaproteobacteria bacterium]|jgi:hypothetical protein|nr:hypothetical protein [Deltaproteobacteria bacterium]
MTVNIQEASGLGGLANTPLAQLYLYEKIMDRYYEHDFLGEITNSEIQERITSCAQEVQIIKAPDVGDWNSYSLGQEMVHNSATFTATKLSICYAAYLALQFDDVQMHWTCDWPKYEEKILESCYENFVKHQRSWVFSELVSGVDPHNQGNNAGLYANHNLGSKAAPLRITPTNLPLFLGTMQIVLQEQNHWVDNEMFLVVPREFRNIFMLSNYANVSMVGGSKSTLIDGMWHDLVDGFNVIETNHLPSMLNSGHQCFYMIAGHRDAYAYAADIIGERITKAENVWVTKYQMLAVWGGAMLNPNFLVIPFGYFDPDMSL